MTTAQIMARVADVFDASEDVKPGAKLIDELFLMACWDFVLDPSDEDVTQKDSSGYPVRTSRRGERMCLCADIRGMIYAAYKEGRRRGAASTGAGVACGEAGCEARTQTWRSCGAGCKRAIAYCPAHGGDARAAELMARHVKVHRSLCDVHTFEQRGGDLVCVHCEHVR